MPLNTKKVTGRRVVRYESFDEIVEDAERLASVPTQTLGNWSVGQIYCHLAKAADVLIDGAPTSAPVPIQWVLRTFLKKKLLSQSLSPGFMLPKRAAALIPGEISTEQGLQLLRVATARIKADPNRAPTHPAFGQCTAEDWYKWHLRHCEMHMSFIVEA
jgi:hypothetical protein